MGNMMMDHVNSTSFSPQMAAHDRNQSPHSPTTWFKSQVLVALDISFHPERKDAKIYFFGFSVSF